MHSLINLVLYHRLNIVKITVFNYQYDVPMSIVSRPENSKNTKIFNDIQVAKTKQKKTIFAENVILEKVNGQKPTKGNAKKKRKKKKKIAKEQH